MNTHKDRVFQAEIALACADRCWHVFPVGPNGPLVKWLYGVSPATADQEQLRKWWRRWPDARVGIATGALSDLVAIDLDVKNGHDGVSAFAHLVRSNGPVPHGVRWRTKSGGVHLLFEHPGIRVRNSAGALGDGIDVRGDGGFIICYRAPRADETIPPLPDWLAEKLTALPSEKPFPAEPVQVHCPDRRWAVAIEREAAEVATAPRGGRNARLYLAACRLTRFCRDGLDPATIRLALLDAAERCGLPDAEARRSIKSALDWRART